MSQSNELLSAGAQLIGMPLAGPESFSAEQLAYLKRALGVDETVLWSGTPTDTVTLNESMNNFEFIDVYERWDNNSANSTVHRIYMEGKTTAVINFSIGTNTWYLVVQKLNLNGTSLSVNSVHTLHGTSYTSTDIIHESNTTLLKNTIVKVVGIHRIAGGN